MKKIKVSTVQQQADVEVIFVNSTLISKCLKAQMILERLIDILTADGCIIPRYNTETDEEGNVVTDERGVVKYTPTLNEQGKQIIDYTHAKFDADDVRDLNETVFPFLNELANAFEE